MSFNNGNERRKLNAKWEHLRVQFKNGNSSAETFSSLVSTTPSVQSKAGIVRQAFSRTMWEIFTRPR